MSIGVWACSTPYTDLHWGWTWRTLCGNLSASPSAGLGPAEFAQRYAGPGRGAMLAADFVRAAEAQVIPPIGAEGLNRRPPVGSCRLFLGPGFRLGARWNRLVETVKTRKKREFSGKKWARYGLKGVKDGS